jgi:hypothetical protein
MDTDSLSSGQFGGMTSSMGADSSSSSDMSGLGGPTGSSGMPSPMGAGTSSMSTMGGSTGGY